MAELDPTGITRANKAVGMILKALGEIGTGQEMAKLLMCDPSEITNLKRIHIERIMRMAYIFGFKLVRNTDVTIDSDELRGLQAHSMRLIAYERKNGRLDAEEE